MNQQKKKLKSKLRKKEKKDYLTAGREFSVKTFTPRIFKIFFFFTFPAAIFVCF